MSIGNKFSNGIKKLKDYWEILIILFLGLTPLLWYKKPNSLALGHDMGFPINPTAFFIDRLYLFTERVGLGWDQALGSAAILIHGLEAVISTFGFSIFTTQKIVFIFWFLLPGLAMYWFVSTLHGKKEEWFIRLSASIFYMFNHFLLQAWFIAERTKISLFVALPLVLGLTIGIIEKRIPLAKGLVLLFLVFFFFNGGGGLPLFGGLLLSVSVAFLFFGAIRLRGDIKEFKRLVIIAIGIFASFLLSNFYWVLPTFISYFSTYAKSLSAIGGIQGVLAWSFEISRFASILNVARLQGIPDWYDNPAHPFSSYFINNPILILISFLIPIIVFSSLFLIKRVLQHRRYIIYFNILAVVGIIFTAGSHPPFGAIYNLFLSFIPGFAIFRTPFYKFAPALWFAYAYLFSFSIYFLIYRFKILQKKYIKNIIFTSILIGILGYSFPFFTASFFNWKEPFSTMTSLPPHVIEFDKWADSNLTFNDRVLTFPQQNSSWNSAIYNWGYWSTAPIESLITNKSIITNDRVMSGPEKKLTDTIYESITEESDIWKSAASKLGINYFLLHNDFYYNAPKFETEPPSLYKDRFTNLGLGNKISIGNWDVFNVPDSSPERISVGNPYLFVGTKDLLEDEFFEISSILSVVGDEDFYFTTNKSADKKNIYSKIFFIENCLFCDKEDKKFTLNLPKTTILPGSIFYQLVKHRQEIQRGSLSVNINSEIDFYLGTTLKRLSEINRLVELKRDERIISSVISDFENEVDALESALERLPKDTTASSLTILKVNNFLREETRELGKISRNSRPKIREDILALSSNISQIYQKYAEYEFEYPQDNEKIYLYNIESEGAREILFQADDLVGVDEFLFDGRKISSSGAMLGDYVSFGEEFFSKGEHTLKFVLGDTPNLLAQTNKPLSFTISPNSSECRNFNIPNIESNKIYNLKFDYVTERSAGSDSGPYIAIKQIAQSESFSSASQLKANSSLQTLELKVPTSSQTKQIDISICPSPGFEDSSTIRIENLSFNPFLTPSVLLISGNEAEFSLPELNSRQISQTHYRADVIGAVHPYVLKLNNSFNSNWELFLNGKEIGKDNHIIVNGFANGWIVNEKGDYTLDIKYKPQKYFYIGWLVTFIFLFISLFYVIYTTLKNYGRKN